jgi:hypothetical protein
VQLASSLRSAADNICALPALPNPSCIGSRLFELFGDHPELLTTISIHPPRFLADDLPWLMGAEPLAVRCHVGLVSPVKTNAGTRQSPCQMEERAFAGEPALPPASSPQ